MCYKKRTHFADTTWEDWHKWQKWLITSVPGKSHKLRKHVWGGRGSQNAYGCLRGGGGYIWNAYVSILKIADLNSNSKLVLKLQISNDFTRFCKISWKNHKAALAMGLLPLFFPKFMIFTLYQLYKTHQM